MQRFLGVAAALFCAVRAVAGPLAPCVQAVRSASENYLVITNAEFPHPLPPVQNP